MRQTILGVFGVLAIAACSSPTSGPATLQFGSGGPDPVLQFGTLGSALGYNGPYLIPPFPDGGLSAQAQDAGPALYVEVYDGPPGVACNEPYYALATYVTVDAGGNLINTIEAQPSMYPLTILIAGFPDTGLVAGSVPLVPSAVGSAMPAASMILYQIDGSQVISAGGSINVTASSSSNITGTISGWGNYPPTIAGATKADVAAVVASSFADPQLLADADAGADISVLYAEALNDALDGGATTLSDALLADPDAGGSFTLSGNFNAPICPTLYIPQP